MDDLLKYSIIARYYLLSRPFNNTTFLDLKEASRNSLIFTASLNIDISPSLYDRDLDKSTLDAAIQHGYIGNSSATSKFQLFLPGETKEPLYQAVVNTIRVDPATRRPKHFPGWFKEKYRNGGFTDKPFILKPFVRPPVTFTNKIKVGLCDLKNDTNSLAVQIDYYEGGGSERQSLE